MIPYMNHGRWVADCPSPNCSAAEKVLPWQAVAVCNCQDRDFCQHSIPCATVIALDWPSDCGRIEAAVASRPLLNRNWYPWESVEGLEKENAAHGVDSS